MKYSTLELQGRLHALGFDAGPLDNRRGPTTNKARDRAIAHFELNSERELFHSSGIHRIHWHWTAGAEGVIDFERRPYHRVIDDDGFALHGLFDVEANASPVAPGQYAPHTFNFNGNAAGVSIDAMHNAVESPFSWGPNPIKEVQVEGLVRESAILCREFWIPVSKWSTLSHSEVQPTFGVRQKWKWDINILPDMSAPGDPIEVGNRIRAMVREELGDVKVPQLKPAMPTEEVSPPAVDDATRLRWRIAEMIATGQKAMEGK